MMDLKDIVRLCASRDYAQALGAIRERERAGAVSGELLARKAICLQLVDDGGDLDEVDAAFQMALELEPDSTFALVEYGWFLLNVRDAATEALDCFRRAMEIQKGVNTEVLTGIMRCVRENDPAIDLTRTLSDLESGLVDDARIRERLQGG